MRLLNLPTNARTIKPPSLLFPGNKVITTKISSQTCSAQTDRDVYHMITRYTITRIATLRPAKGRATKETKKKKKRRVKKRGKGE